MPKKVLTIFGTRPEAIKLAPVIKELEKYPEQIKSFVCVTAQHRSMMDQVLDLFEIVPDFDLNIMTQGQDLYDITSKVIYKLKAIIKEITPDVVLVQGDTTTTFVGSLSSFYSKINVGHVEAGLRTFSKYAPFPEEINRRLTSVIADYHFTPTEKAKNNLIREGIDKNIYVTGNTVIDALLLMVEKVKNKKKEDWDCFNNIDLSKKIILVTGHRRENFGKGFLSICNALRELSCRFPNFNFIYPVHLNPNVKRPVHEILDGLKNVILLDPMDYEPFVYLMNLSYMIISDSGGVQEEAPSLGKPVLVTRDTTERPEAVEAGTVKLVGTDKNKIVNETIKLLEDKSYYNQMAFAHNPYGDGNAAKRIAEILLLI